MKTDNTLYGFCNRALPVATLYLAGMLQGLTLVSFPASSAVLKSMHGFTDAQYGAIFLPQVAAAIIGALLGGGLADRLGLRPLLWIALAINALSQGLLAGSLMLEPGAAYAMVLAGTASLGLAFGLSGAPLNGYPPLLFPHRRDTAIVALHTFLGLGLAIGPVIASPFIMAGHWIGFPLSLAGFALLLIAGALLGRFPPAEAQSAGSSPTCDPMPLPQSMMDHRAGHPVRVTTFWLFCAVAVLYAFAEGTFSNWAVLYLLDVKQLPETVAAGALSVFWGAMVAGRLLTSLLVLRLAPVRIWLLLPLLMITAFLSLPYANTPLLGIGLFALAGLACSAFFPLSIGIVSERFPAHGPWVSSMMIAALMAGVGLGSWMVGLLRDAFAMETLYRLSVMYPLLALGLAVLALRPRSGTPAATRLSGVHRMPDADRVG
jgi:fucose permease